MDLSVAPGDDFFAFANGTWAARTGIPPDRSSWGVFNVLADKSTLRTRDLLEAAARSAAPARSARRQVGDYYASYLDEAAIEAAGTTPLRPLLDRISAIDTATALARVLGEDLRADVDPLNSTDFHTDRLFGLWVSPDMNDPARTAPYLLQGGLDLPDREYCVSDTPPMTAIRTKYPDARRIDTRLAGIPDPEGRTARVVALEQKMAAVHATRLESLRYARRTTRGSALNFRRALRGSTGPRSLPAPGLDAQPVIIAWHPRAIAGLRPWSRASRSRPGRTGSRSTQSIAMRPSCRARSWTSVSRSTGHVSGTPQISVRWKRAVEAVPVGRWARPSRAVRGPAFPTRHQGSGPCDGGEYRGRVRPSHPAAGVDVTRDESQGAREAVDAAGRRRLPRQIDRLLRARRRAWRRLREQPASVAVRVSAATSHDCSTRPTRPNGR